MLKRGLGGEEGGEFLNSFVLEFIITFGTKVQLLCDSHIFGVL